MGDEAALPLAWRILLAVHDEQIARADRAQQGVPLTRLSKRLDASVSVLMREITMLTDAVLGTQRGPGLLREFGAGDVVQRPSAATLVTTAGRMQLGGDLRLGIEHVDVHVGEIATRIDGLDVDSLIAVLVRIVAQPDA